MYELVAVVFALLILAMPLFGIVLYHHFDGKRKYK